MESRLPVGRQLAISLGVLLLAAALLVVPRWTGWTLEHVHKEDGFVFLADFTRNGWGALFETYTGYLHVAPRTITGVCAALPPVAFASCIGVAAASFRLLLAIVALAVLGPYAKTWRWALASAVMFVAVPVGQEEALGNVTNLRWFCDAIALLCLVGRFTRPRLAVVATIVAVVSVLSDPLTLALVPLALWRVITDRGWGRLVPVGYLVAAAGLAAVIQPGARTADTAMFVEEPMESLTQVLVRGLGVAQFGQNGIELIMRVGGVALVLACLALPLAVLHVGLSCMPANRRHLPLVLALSGIGFVAATIVFTELNAIRLNEYWAVGQASRYSVTPGILVGQALILSASALAGSRWAKLLQFGALAALAVAFAADSPGDPWNVHGPEWGPTINDARERCTPGRSEHVPLTPDGVPHEWMAALECDWILGGG